MFDRFTDRARRALALANAEAGRLGREWIEPEHILLGLVKEGSGVGANVLKNLGLDLRDVRLEVEKLAEKGTGTVTTGKLPPDPGAERAMEFAIAEARQLGHSYVGTEHLLLGLLREERGVAVEVLAKFDLRLQDVRWEVMLLLEQSLPTSERDQLDSSERYSEHPLVRRMMQILEKQAASVESAVQARDRQRVSELDEVVRDLEEYLDRVYRMLDDRATSDSEADE
jgi:ATP-dependent Clp protease ATP-binding subunit ClpC